MTQSHTLIRAYRIVTLALALFFFAYQFTLADYSAFGLHFRHLTVWGHVASLFCAYFMFMLSMGWTQQRRETLVSVTVVLNAVVVLMYWKIYFTDPALFYGADGGPDNLAKNYYLHAVGPALQMIDAFFFLGAFTKLKRVFLYVLGLPVVYIAWAELILQPLNTTPAGSVTTGLPYLFLNNMGLEERGGFYLTTILTMLALFVGCACFAWGLRKLGVTPSRKASLRSP